MQIANSISDADGDGGTDRGNNIWRFHHSCNGGGIKIRPIHYENTPIQNILKILPQKIENFQIKNSDIFHFSA